MKESHNDVLIINDANVATHLNREFPCTLGVRVVFVGVVGARYVAAAVESRSREVAATLVDHGRCINSERIG